jgi:pantoate--beta-alanine ligase
MRILVKKIYNKHSSFESVSLPLIRLTIAHHAVLKDLLISHPTPENMHIISTSRDPKSNVALSSRNAYLSEAEMGVAPVLFKALSAAKEAYEKGGDSGEDLISRATAVVLEQQAELGGPGASTGIETAEGGVDLRIDYFEVFDKDTFQPVRGEIEKGRELVIAGAVWVGQTRLIDNLLLGWGM